MLTPGKRTDLLSFPFVHFGPHQACPMATKAAWSGASCHSGKGIHLRSGVFPRILGPQDEDIANRLILENLARVLFGLPTAFPRCAADAFTANSGLTSRSWQPFHRRIGIRVCCHPSAQEVFLVRLIGVLGPAPLRARAEGLSIIFFVPSTLSFSLTVPPFCNNYSPPQKICHLSWWGITTASQYSRLQV